MLLNNPNNSSPYPALHQYQVFSTDAIELTVTLILADGTAYEPVMVDAAANASHNLADLFEDLGGEWPVRFQSAVGADVANRGVSPVFVNVGNTRALGTELSTASQASTILWAVSTINHIGAQP